MCDEKWAWIIYRGHDFTGKYMISDHGNVKSVDRYTKSSILQRQTNQTAIDTSSEIKHKLFHRYYL